MSVDDDTYGQTPDPILWMSVGTLRAAPPPEVKFLWGGRENGLIQEKSFVMLHSSEKQGKSMFLLNLAVAGARGDAEFLGIKLRPGGFRTLILQCEVHLRAMYERFEEMLKNGDLTTDQAENIVINGYRAITLTNQRHLYWFKRKVTEWKPDVVGIDPLAHMLTVDENSNVEVGKGLAPLLKLRDDPGVTVVVVHHDSKVSETSGSRPAQQRSRGANRLTADPDSIISLTPMRRTGGPVARISCTPRYGKQMEPFRVRLNEDTFWFERFSAATEHGEILQAIIIEAGGLMQEKDLVIAASEKWDLHDAQHDHRTVRKRIAEAVKAEMIYKYDLPTGVAYGATAPPKQED